MLMLAVERNHCKVVSSAGAITRRPPSFKTCRPRGVWAVSTNTDATFTAMQGNQITQLEELTSKVLQ